MKTKFIIYKFYFYSREKWLDGAVLDVFSPEPLRSDSPLWTMPGVYITPHLSGVSLSKQVILDFLLLENKIYVVWDVREPVFWVNHHDLNQSFQLQRLAEAAWTFVFFQITKNKTLHFITFPQLV